MARIDVDDVQGIVLRSYDDLKYLSFVLLAFPKDPGAARKWLGTLLRDREADRKPEVTSAARAPAHSAVNVAFTHAGLVALELPAETLAGFAREFREDAEIDPHRNRALGDEDGSHPEKWIWGGPSPKIREDVHVALLLYADDATALDQLYRSHHVRFTAAGLRVLHRVEAEQRQDSKEHFGFHDGISQPWIENNNPSAEQVEALAPGPTDNSVKAGEFLYGYRDEFGEVPLGPQVPAGLDPAGFLRRDATGTPDFGRNGTYLVARQLAQDVRGFWRFIFGNSGKVGQVPVELAAKMVGRWPDGSPLVQAPNGPNPNLANAAGFRFSKEGDTAGHKCPLGSHIRRANPRDTLLDYDAEESIRIVKRHRLIRRGRPYGPALDESMDPQRMVEAPDSEAKRERGLLFLAFNVHLSRQFEFIQQNWLNNPKFAKLSTDADPIAGAPGPDATFTQQRESVRLRTTGLTSFVKVDGSAYFFMPGLAALRYLAEGVQPVRRDVPRLPLGEPAAHPGDRRDDRPEEQPLTAGAEQSLTTGAEPAPPVNGGPTA